MRFLKDLPELSGKKVLLRADFNVPISGGRVVDSFRIDKTIPTISFLREKDAQLIIVSHYEGKEGNTLKPVAEFLEKIFPVSFITNPFSDEGKSALQKAFGEKKVVLIENLRVWPGEKDNDDSFAKSLASLADIYVNDAFSVSHRKHASVVGVPKHIPAYVGLLLEDEVKNLSKAFDPARPFLFVLGGAKFDTKMPLIEKFFKKADMVFVGGALANNFFKEKGFPLGKSLVSEGDFKLGQFSTDRLFIPPDVVVQSERGTQIIKPTDVAEDETIVDSGPETSRLLQKLIWKAEFILWNGPLGNYELGFTGGTEDLAKAIAQSKRDSVVGGGDTLAAIAKLNLFNKLSFVSTGGGAMLDFLANETLPGIEVLN